jgi:hypothetical protein
MKRALASIVVVMAGCGSGAGVPAEEPATPVATPTEPEPAEPTEPTEPSGVYDERVLAVAAEYQGWGRVDEQLRAAPTACAAPMQPPRARMSASDDGGTHGQKLYSVWAKERAQYAHDRAPVGQVVVKESWLPELVTDLASIPSSLDTTFHPYARVDGKTYKAGEPAGLFVMMKVGAEATPGTDQGWIYGTISPDGALTSAGLVDTCMGCHESAPHDRLFGLHR